MSCGEGAMILCDRQGAKLWRIGLFDKAEVAFADLVL